MRCTALKASSFDRPTWKVAKVRRRSRGDPVKASPAADAAGVRLDGRRSAAGGATDNSSGLGAVLVGEAHSGSGLLVNRASGAEERTEIRICPTGPTSAFSAEATCPA